MEWKNGIGNQRKTTAFNVTAAVRKEIRAPAPRPRANRYSSAWTAAVVAAAGTHANDNGWKTASGSETHGRVAWNVGRRVASWVIVALESGHGDIALPKFEKPLEMCLRFAIYFDGCFLFQKIQLKIDSNKGKKSEKIDSS